MNIPRKTPRGSLHSQSQIKGGWKVVSFNSRLKGAQMHPAAGMSHLLSTSQG